ncbi:hypothetical protein KI659_04665, partial [Litoribacter alkaliphilus]
MRKLLLLFTCIAWVSTTYAQMPAPTYPAGSEPTVVSDKDDYAPGEVAIITGSGWTLDTSVRIHIEEEPHYDHHNDFNVAVKPDGTWRLEFPIDERHLGVAFHLEATGNVTGYLAETFFTDANVRFSTSGLPNGVNVTVEYSGTAPGPTPVNSSVTFSTSGSGNSGAIALIGNLIFSFPASLSAGGNTYILIGTTPNSPANVPATGNFPIVGNYTLQTGSEGSIGSVSVAPQSSTVVFGSSNSIDFVVTSVRASNGNVNGTYTVNGFPSGVSGVFDQPTFNSSGSNAFPGSILTVSVPNNVNAGSYPFTVTLSTENSGSGVAEGILVIDKAPTTTTVSINGGPFTYTGSAIEPATVSVTGAGGLNLTPEASYADNVNAGTATASYSYAGDNNYLSSSDSEEFTIGKAATVTTVTINGGPFTYTGSAIEPAAVSVIGAGNLSLSPDALYDNNINAGTATVSFFFEGDNNYEPSSDIKTFIIGKASLTVVNTDRSKVYG